MANTTPQTSSSPTTRIALIAVGVLAVALAAWMLWPPNATVDDAAPPSTEQNTEATAPDPVEDFRGFAAKLDPANPDAAVMVDGLRRLAGALGALGAGTPELAVDLRILAEHIVLNPDAAETAASTREALVAAANALDDGGEELREAAEAIDPAQPLSAQQGRIVDFLRRAGDAMGRHASGGQARAERLFLTPRGDRRA